MASAELRKARRGDGVQVGYSHQGGGATTLWARVSDQLVEHEDEDGVLLEGEVRRFRIPLQTGFTGAVSENDEIAWNAKTFVALRGWRTESHDGVYVITAVRGQLWRARA